MKRLVAVLALVLVLALIAFANVVARGAPVVGSGDAAATPQQPSGEAAAQSEAPEISLRLNGFAPGATPVVLTAGEPVLVELQLRHPDRRAKEPIRLEPPTGSWAERAKIVVTDGQGTVRDWRFVVTGKLSPGGLALKPAAVTTLVLRMDEDARRAIVPGSYKMIARLEPGDGRGFRGTIDSEPAAVNMVAASGQVAGAALGRRQLLRVRDSLLRGDVARAETAAMEMQRAEPERPEGFVGMALVHEAKGERSRALFSVEIAISCAVGRVDEAAQQDKTMSRREAGQKPPKMAPVEYYELLRRIERLPLETPNW